MSTKNKPRRYRNLVKHFSNWPQYLGFKIFNYSQSFDFQLKDAFAVRVPRQMLSAFRECFFDQIYLKHLPDHMLKFDRPIIIDIGANVGYFSLFMFYQYPKAQIFSFEPMPFNFKKLQKYQEEFSQFNWNINNKAVSGQQETITLHAVAVDDYTTMASVFDKPSNSQHIEVETVTLPQVLTNNNIDQIDILKLDCEGSEYAILYALPTQTLQTVKVLIIETHLGSEPGENTEALKSYLQENGFSLHYLVEGNAGYIWAWRD